MRKVLVYFLVTMLTMVISIAPVFAYSSIDIAVTPGKDVAIVDGEDVLLEVPAKIINNRTMVPIRFVAESLGFKVVWDGSTKRVTIGDNNNILLKIGSKTATVDGATFTLDAPPTIENGRTLIPLRFVSESLGAEISWDSKEKIATIEYSEQMIKARELYGQPVAGEEKVLAALDDKFAYKVATTLANFGDAKDGRGMHLVGSTAGKAAAQYAFDTFKEIGLTPQFHTFKATGWEYYDSSLKIKNHEDLKYFITSAPHTPATSVEGITAEIVYVGTATKEELKDMDLTGKIALVEFDWDNILWMSNLEYQVAAHGAIGVIYFTTNGYGTDKSGQAEFVGDWSGKQATIPTWSMRQIDGFALAKLAEKEKITVTAISDSKTIPDATGYNVMATIQGAKYPDEYIVITAHTDAYFHCLQDDSAPVGVMMSMAKAMVDSGYKPDRSIVFVTTDGEEAGGGETFYDWLVGSWALVNDKVNEWDGKIVDAHTIEMLGDNQSTNFGYRVSDIMYLFTKGMAFGMNASGDYSNNIQVDNFMTTSSDEWAFSYMGNASTRTIMENSADEVYHSTMDNPNRFSYKNFVENMKSQSTIIMRIDKQVIAPYDLARDAEIYQRSLDNESLKSQGLDEGSMSSTLNLYINNAQKLIDLNLQISDLYKKAMSEGKNLAEVNKLIENYNKSLRLVAKTTIQGTQYVALDIPVNQIEYYQRIPGVFEEAIAVLKAGKGEELLDALYGLDSDDMGQYSVWYSECLEYNTWVNQYHEALSPEKPNQDVKWVTGILLKYYDFYAVLESVNKKIESGGKDFTAEINELTKMKLDAEKRLADGFNKDLQMWGKANSQLQINQAEKILKELQ